MRYFLPVMPFFFYFFALGLFRLGAKLKLKNTAWPAMALTSFVLLFYAANAAREIPGNVANARA